MMCRWNGVSTLAHTHTVDTCQTRNHSVFTTFPAKIASKRASSSSNSHWKCERKYPCRQPSNTHTQTFSKSNKTVIQMNLLCAKTATPHRSAPYRTNFSSPKTNYYQKQQRQRQRQQQQQQKHKRQR